MLRFFRLLRKKFLEEGHIRKYFWYYLGEISLVMIGILLALQVNNWNNSRIEEQESNHAMERLLEDLYEEVAILRTTYEYLNTVLDYAEAAMDIYESGSIDDRKTADQFLTNLYQASQIQESVQSNFTYLEIISSGKLDLIYNEDIRTSLLAYYSYSWPNSIVFTVEDHYRENIRKVIPRSVQSKIREDCGDVYTRISGTVRVTLKAGCKLEFDESGYAVANSIIKDETLKKDLLFRIGNLKSQLELIKSFQDEAQRVTQLLESDQ